MSLGIFTQPNRFARPLGQASSLTWKNQTPNERVKAFQAWINVYLKKYGFYPIAVDGKLGPATCGAELHMLNTRSQQEIDWSSSPINPDEFTAVCKVFTYPTKVGSTRPEINPVTLAEDRTTAALPWGIYSPDTLVAQKRINEILVGLGMVPIGTDGKLGPATCGAFRFVERETGNTWEYNQGANCKSFVMPRKAATPAETVPTGPPGPTTPGVPEPGLPAPKKGISKGAMLAGAGILAVAGVGTYYYGQKKGWF